MILPKVIKIFGVDYKVVPAKRDSLFANEQDGILDWKKQTIYIMGDYPIKQQYKILIHEIFHVISNDLLLGFGEQIIEQLATSIFSVLADNNLLKE